MSEPAHETMVVPIHQKSWQKPEVAGLLRDLEALAPELKNYRKEIEAKIRRLLHADKISVYNRAVMICDPHWSEDMREKLDYHTYMAKASDDQVLKQ